MPFFSKNIKKFVMSSQVEMVSLEELVPASHVYRKFKELWDFTELNHYRRLSVGLSGV